MRGGSATRKGQGAGQGKTVPHPFSEVFVGAIIIKMGIRIVFWAMDRKMHAGTVDPRLYGPLVPAGPSFNFARGGPGS